MRLVSLELNDFQVHKHIAVDFGKSITCIRGETDKGKSSILRALRWVCLNDIPGEEFIRIGAKRTVVKLLVKVGKDRHEIVRIRGGGTNEYWLDSKVYRSFNNGVPPDIAAVLNLNEINFQAQHDSPYWFTETAGEVSRRLNAIIDLSVIDTALSNVAAEVRKAQERKTISEERLTAAKKEYEELEPQRTRIQEFDRLRQYHEKFTGLETDADSLQSIVDRIRANREKAQLAAEHASDGGAVLLLARQAIGFERRVDSLQCLLTDIQHNRAAAQPPPDFSTVNQAFKKWQEMEEQTQDLSSLVSRISSTAFATDVKRERFIATEKQFYKQIKGNLCPTCGQLL